MLSVKLHEDKMSVSYYHIYHHITSHPPTIQSPPPLLLHILCPLVKPAACQFNPWDKDDVEMLEPWWGQHDNKITDTDNFVFTTARGTQNSLSNLWGMFWGELIWVETIWFLRNYSTSMNNSVSLLLVIIWSSQTISPGTNSKRNCQ